MNHNIEVMSLNIEDLDVEELERRLEFGAWTVEGGGSATNDGWSVEVKGVYTF